VSLSRAELDQSDFLPFAEAIKNDAPMIMVTHVAVPALDPTNTPASLSKPITTDLLKTQMGFKGVVITDDLEMGAITLPAGEAAVAAVAAGADIVMFAHTPAKQEEARKALIAAVKDGKLMEDDINKSVVRILDMKKKYRLEKPAATS
jgi:beta-N-acetylhexosaminidase